MKSYSKKEIKEKLLKLGVSRGDCLFLSSSLGMLGRPKGFKAKDLNKIFLKTILEIIGNRGTLFVPTYSYSFSSKNKNSVLILKKQSQKLDHFQISSLNKTQFIEMQIHLFQYLAKVF